MLHSFFWVIIILEWNFIYVWLLCKSNQNGLSVLSAYWYTRCIFHCTIFSFHFFDRFQKYFWELVSQTFASIPNFVRSSVTRKKFTAFWVLTRFFTQSFNCISIMKMVNAFLDCFQWDLINQKINKWIKSNQSNHLKIAFKKRLFCNNFKLSLGKV